MALLLSFVTVFSTLAGGTFALRNRDRLHLALGFSAGVILGVVAFDLLPEVVDLSERTSTPFRNVMIAFAVGFLAFHLVEKALVLHHAHEHEYGTHHHPSVGLASALALSGHSLADGIGIGLAFHVNHSIGIAAALAVISHDFVDGLNTVSLMLVNGNTRRRAWALLAVDALAPAAGAGLTYLFTVPTHYMLIYLGVFTGFLLYIGASDVLPEAHANHPSRATVALTVAGAAAMFGLTAVLP
jgi:ZIP family zinc transporter